MHLPLLRPLVPAIAIVVSVWAVAFAASTYAFSRFGSFSPGIDLTVGSAFFLVTAGLSGYVLSNHLHRFAAQEAKKQLQEIWSRFHPLPDSERNVLRIHRQYFQADEAAQEIFRTLVADTPASPSGTPDYQELLDAAKSLASTGGK